jgi:calcium permeable stress-gated cation channel
MPQTGEADEEIEGDGSDDFGGDESPVDSKDPKPTMEKKKSPIDEIDNPNIAPGNRIGHAAAAPTGHVQHNQGPGPSAQYGDSVPVEGKRNEGPTDFNHPASVEPQRIVWLPQDPLGLSDVEVRELKGHNVEASNENANISGKGTVDIDGHPPGSDPTTIFG